MQRADLRSIPVRCRQEILLVHRSEHHRHGALQHLVLEGRNAEGSLPAISFRDVRPSNWRSLVRAALEPVEQSLQVLVQFALVFLGCDVIDSRRPILASQFVRFPHQGHVDVMSETQNWLSGQLPCQLCYPLQFR